jgi:choline dehydrogenase-like flavoprotein
VQSSAFNEDDKHFYIQDHEHPYIQEKPFLWKRGYQVGGRSLVWGRQCYRLSDLDFEANLKEGIAVDWPIRYKDIAPWYDYVESFVGISGQAEGLAHLPDGQFLPPMELNCIENHLKSVLYEKFQDRILTIARVANVTKGWNGRGPCQQRNLCTRGCPFGGYFSSNSATLPIAFNTGNLSLRPFSVVQEIIYDPKTQKANGVRIMDAETKEIIEYYARIIFVNASTINTAALLLNSTSEAFPTGLGNSSGQLGLNLMDHHTGNGATGMHEDFKEFYYKGRRPCGFYIPRFKNINESATNPAFKRGYGIQGDGERMEWRDTMQHAKGFGKAFKEELIKPGPWTVWMGGWGECLPYAENKVSLHSSEKDDFGMPIIKVDFEFRENEKAMMSDIRNSCHEMLDKAGFKNINTFNYNAPGGATVHEMGTARMGKDAKTSVLNAFNQMHDVQNVFITDGSCMTSSSCQNPSLTYMALTARACNYAVAELKKGNI